MSDFVLSVKNDLGLPIEQVVYIEECIKQVFKEDVKEVKLINNELGYPVANIDYMGEPINAMIELDDELSKRRFLSSLKTFKGMFLGNNTEVFDYSKAVERLQQGLPIKRVDWADGIFIKMCVLEAKNHNGKSYPIPSVLMFSGDIIVPYNGELATELLCKWEFPKLNKKAE